MLLYCLRVVVLCCLIIETRKVVSVVSCGVVVQEIVRLTGAVLVWCCCRVVCGVVDSLCFGFGVVDRVKGWEVRKRFRELYPMRNPHFVIEF